MKIKDLIKKLQECPDHNRSAYIIDDSGVPVDFTGFGCDDNLDVELYEIGGDRRG